ncbi:hypothetical protein BC835DRAFT_1311040 [Cytidiella melzeri]|nr:hypothetical protein BC835DRAFT_1311040 [Cytidiella melzeri]
MPLALRVRVKRPRNVNRGSNLRNKPVTDPGGSEHITHCQRVNAAQARRVASMALAAVGQAAAYLNDKGSGVVAVSSPSNMLLIESVTRGGSGRYERSTHLDASSTSLDNDDRWPIRLDAVVCVCGVEVVQYRQQQGRSARVCGPVLRLGAISQLLVLARSLPLQPPNSDKPRDNFLTSHIPSQPLTARRYHHNNKFTAIFSAIGLFRQPLSLDLTNPSEHDVGASTINAVGMHSVCRSLGVDEEHYRGKRSTTECALSTSPSSASVL